MSDLFSYHMVMRVDSNIIRPVIDSHPNEDDPESVKFIMKTFASKLSNELFRYDLATYEKEVTTDEIGHYVADHAGIWIAPFLESVYSLSFQKSISEEKLLSWCELICMTYLNSHPIIK